MSKLKLKVIPLKKRDNKDYPMISNNDYMLSYSPSFSLIDKQVPEIVDWEVGKKYKMVVEVEMRSKNEVKNGDEKIGVSGSFDILSYSVSDKVDEMTDEELEEMQGEVLSKK